MGLGKILAIASPSPAPPVSRYAETSPRQKARSEDWPVKGNAGPSSTTERTAYSLLTMTETRADPAYLMALSIRLPITRLIDSGSPRMNVLPPA